MAQLTELDGVGPKTAEGLKSKGYRSKEDLIEAYREGRLLNSDVPSRVETAIQKDLLDRGESFVDPRSGVEVSPDRRRAFETFASRGVNETIDGFGGVTRNAPRFQDRNFVELAGMAMKGKLGSGLSPDEYEEIGYRDYRGTNRKSKKNSRQNRTKLARRRAYEMGLDAAANLSDFDRGDLEAGNELARSLGGSMLRTGFTYEDTYEIAGETKTTEKNERVSPRSFAAASAVHRSRSPRSRRVDERKDAPITTDLDQWAAAPSRFDYPGVDTPTGSSDFSNDRDRDRAGEAAAVFEEATDDVRAIALGDVDRELF